MSTKRGSGKLLLVVLSMLVFLMACGRTESQGVRSHLEGRITVHPEIDSTGDYRGFEVLVLQRGEEQVDTLGYAVTDSTGHFATDVTAPERGVYPLLVLREGQILAQGDLVVASGDSATMRVQLPFRGGFLRIRSKENAAWIGYKNLKAAHNQEILQAVQKGRQDVGHIIERTARMLWGLETTYPGTVGAQIARAEAVTMVTSWNDSLALAWARMIPPDNPGVVEVARAAATAAARTYGLDSALAVLRQFQERVPRHDQRAALQAALVQTYADSLHIDEALAALRELRRSFPEPRWQAWATQAEYELKHLMPGQPAPSFTALTTSGETFDLQKMRGKYVVVEFWSPRDLGYARQLPAIHALLEKWGDRVVWVSVALEKEKDVYEAFAEGRELPGIQILEESGAESSLVKLYGIRTLPYRYLIGPDGTILGKYTGQQLFLLEQVLEQHLASSESKE